MAAISQSEINKQAKARALQKSPYIKGADVKKRTAGSAELYGQKKTAPTTQQAQQAVQQIFTPPSSESELEPIIGEASKQAALQKFIPSQGITTAPSTFGEYLTQRFGSEEGGQSEAEKRQRQGIQEAAKKESIFETIGNIGKGLGKFVESSDVQKIAGGLAPTAGEAGYWLGRGEQFGGREAGIQQARQTEQERAKQELQKYFQEKEERRLGLSKEERETKRAKELETLKQQYETGRTQMGISEQAAQNIISNIKDPKRKAESRVAYEQFLSAPANKKQQAYNNFINKTGRSGLVGAIREKVGI